MVRSLYSTFLIALIMLMSSTIVLAQETDVAADVPVDPPPMQKPMPLRPLDAIRRAQEAKQQIQQNAIGARRTLQEDTVMHMKNATSGAEKRGIMQGAIQNRKDIAKNRMASSTALKKKIHDAVRLHAGLIRERFTNAVEHLNKLMERIDSRISKLEDAGVDVSSAASLQTSAQSAIDAAKTDIQAVRNFIENVKDTDDRSGVKAELEPLVTEARKSIQEAHGAVRALVKEIVALSKKAKPTPPTATSTESDAATPTE